MGADDSFDANIGIRCLLELPDELAAKCLLIAGGKACALAGMTCTRLHSLALMPSLWRDICHEQALVGGRIAHEARDSSETVAWARVYAHAAHCPHGRGRRKICWEGLDPTSMWLTPAHGVRRTACSCLECGRQFRVELEALETHGDEVAGFITQVSFEDVGSGTLPSPCWREVWYNDYYYQ